MKIYAPVKDTNGIYASGNPEYSGVRFRTLDESHPSA